MGEGTLGKSKLDLTVACFLWGDWCRPKALDYVNNLFSGIKSHLNILHRFVCFTDRSDVDFNSEIECIPLSPEEIELQWNLTKMVAYKPKSGLTGRVLLFDLDVVIVGSLDELASYKGEFVTCEAAYRKGGIGGSFIGFKAGFGLDLFWKPLRLLERRLFYENMTGGSERKYFGMRLRPSGQKVDFWQRLYPGQVLSYKVDCERTKEKPENARIVRFHGKPRPHEIKNHWVLAHWGK